MMSVDATESNRLLVLTDVLHEFFGAEDAVVRVVVFDSNAAIGCICFECFLGRNRICGVSGLMDMHVA